MHHGNSQSTGRSSAAGPQQGIIAWYYDVGEVIGTSVAIGSDSTIYFGSEGPYLWALNWNGTLKWKLKLEGNYKQGNSPLVSSDGTIYIGTRGNLLYAVNPNGTVKWTFKIDDSINNLGMTIGLDGTIYFATSNFWLYAVSPTGVLKWKIGGNYQFQGVEMTGIAMSPDGSTLYLGCLGTAESDTVTGLIAVGVDGNVQWLFRTFPAYGTPLVDNAGNIFFATRRRPNMPYDENRQGIFSITPDGKLRWRYSAKMASMMDPTMDYNGNIYFAIGDQPSSFTLVSLDNIGNLRWKFSDKNFNTVSSSLICDCEGNVYLTTESYRLFAFTASGNLKWELKIGEVAWLSPALAHGRLFLGISDYELGKTFYCIK